jgi:hypothetical protein
MDAATIKESKETSHRRKETTKGHRWMNRRLLLQLRLMIE